MLFYILATISGASLAQLVIDGPGAPTEIEGGNVTGLKPVESAPSGEITGTGQIQLEPQPSLETPIETPTLQTVKGPVFLAVTRNTPMTTQFSQGAIKGTCDDARDGMNGCRGEAGIGAKAVATCKTVSRLLGTLEKFKFNGKAFTAAQLRACNGETEAAGGGLEILKPGNTVAIKPEARPQTTLALARKRSGGSLLGQSPPGGAAIKPLVSPQPRLGTSAPQIKTPGGESMRIQDKVAGGDRGNASLQLPGKQKGPSASVMKPLKVQPGMPVQKRTLGSALQEKSGQATFGLANRPVNTGSLTGFEALCQKNTDPWGCALPKIVNTPKVIGPKKGDSRVEINLGLSNFGYAQIEAIDTQSGKSRGVIWKKTSKTSRYIENILPRPVDRPTADTTYRLRVSNPHNTNKPLIKDLWVKGIVSMLADTAADHSASIKLIPPSKNWDWSRNKLALGDDLLVFVRYKNVKKVEVNLLLYGRFGGCVKRIRLRGGTFSGQKSGQFKAGTILKEVCADPGGTKAQVEVRYSYQLANGKWSNKAKYTKWFLMGHAPKKFKVKKVYIVGGNLIPFGGVVKIRAAVLNGDKIRVVLPRTGQEYDNANLKPAKPGSPVQIYKRDILPFKRYFEEELKVEISGKNKEKVTKVLSLRPFQKIKLRAGIRINVDVPSKIVPITAKLVCETKDAREIIGGGFEQTAKSNGNYWSATQKFTIPFAKGSVTQVQTFEFTLIPKIHHMIYFQCNITALYPKQGRALYSPYSDRSKSTFFASRNRIRNPVTMTGGLGQKNLIMMNAKSQLYNKVVNMDLGAKLTIKGWIEPGFTNLSTW